jgi:hypothetical protein
MVFSSSFAAVWHLDDSLATPMVADAKGARNGTAMGGLDASDQIAAQLGGGIDFDGNNNQIQFTNPFSGNGKHTISAWLYQRTPNGCDTIVTVGGASNNRSRFLHSRYVPVGPTPIIGINPGFYVNDWLTGMNITTGTWTLVHWVFEGTNRKSRLFLNGVVVDSFMYAQGIDTQGLEGYLGYAPGGWGNCGLNGTLDEVRLATVDRSDGWIATEYANQSSPQTFYSVGPEEMVP